MKRIVRSTLHAHFGLGVRVAALILLQLALGCSQSPKPSAAPHVPVLPSAPADPVGLSINKPQAFPGYTLLAPLKSTHTFLIDMEGRVVGTWSSEGPPALSAMLLENGHLLRAGLLPGAPGDSGPGAGGRMQEYTWDGELVWDFKYTRRTQLPHHDFTRLPNGNVLLIVWERKFSQELLAAGRRPDWIGPLFLIDCLLEIKPTGKTSGEVVWEWHIWDHLIQDHDASRANYGNVAAHPELVDLNFWTDSLGSIARAAGGMDKLRSIGYVGNAPPGGPSGASVAWSHCNAVAYHPQLDQIMLSVHGFSEIWLIDHSTTKEEAAGHRGGRYRKGGDLLYRWGNPRAYRAGEAADQRLFAQHDAHWIPPGLPGTGHLLVFNNGAGRPESAYSSVEERVLPFARGADATPLATRGADANALVWSFMAPTKSDFYSLLLSSAQRLPNGNTLLCSGVSGTLLEVAPDREVVWKYVNPVNPGENSLFRVHRYGRDYPGLAGKDLTPGPHLEVSGRKPHQGVAGAESSKPR